MQARGSTGSPRLQEGVIIINLYEINKQVREARRLKEEAEQRLAFADGRKREAGYRLAKVYDDNPTPPAEIVDPAVRELSQAIKAWSQALAVANEARQLYRQLRAKQVQMQEASYPSVIGDAA